MTSRLHHITKYLHNLNLLNRQKNCHDQLPGSSPLHASWHHSTRSKSRCKQFPRKFFVEKKYRTRVSSLWERSTQNFETPMYNALVKCNTLQFSFGGARLVIIILSWFLWQPIAAFMSTESKTKKNNNSVATLKCLHFEPTHRRRPTSTPVWQAPPAPSQTDFSILPPYCLNRSGYERNVRDTYKKNEWFLKKTRKRSRVPFFWILINVATTAQFMQFENSLNCLRVWEPWSLILNT